MIHTESDVFKAHRFILAAKSPWFHNFFKKSKNNSGSCDVIFFNIGKNVLKAFLDLSYGKEVTFPLKEKHRLTFFLSKLGVKWEDKSGTECLSTKKTVSTSEEARHEAASMNEEARHEVKVISADTPAKGPKQILSAPPMANILSRTDVLEPPQEEVDTILEEYTITSTNDLQQIGHKKLQQKGQGGHKYKCLKCNLSWQFLSEAEDHHLEHEFEESKNIRAKLKSVELGRARDAKTLSKVEKMLMGKCDPSKIMKVLDKVASNLKNHGETMASMEKDYMSEKLHSKRKEYSNMLKRTVERVEK